MSGEQVTRGDMHDQEQGQGQAARSSLGQAARNSLEGRAGQVKVKVKVRGEARGG